MKRTVRSSIGEVSVREEGIIFGRVFSNSEIELKDATEYYSMIEYLSEGKPHCSIIDLSGAAYMSAEARNYVQNNSQEKGKTIAVAIITNSFSSKVIANFFVTTNKPDFPVMLFTDTLAAHQWAKGELERFHSPKLVY